MAHAPEEAPGLAKGDAGLDRRGPELDDAAGQPDDPDAGSRPDVERELQLVIVGHGSWRGWRGRGGAEQGAQADPLGV